MVLLKDLLELIFDTTVLTVLAYTPDYRLQHKWIFGEEINLMATQESDIRSGKLTDIKRNINYHGREKRGVSETGFGVDIKQIPEELLKSKVFHMLTSGATSGRALFVQVEMPEMAAKMLADELAQDEGAVRIED